MRSPAITRALALLSVALVTVSCDSVTGNGGSFTLTLSDATLSLGQGKKDTVVITLARSSYAKSVALSVDGAPAGITVNLLAPTVPGNSTITGLELTASPTAAIGTSTLTVHATGAGVAERTATVAVAVGVTGSFSLSSQGFPLTAAQGGGADGTVLVTRSGGHADNVTLAATGLPSGVTASFAASPTTVGATSVSIAAAAGAAPGTYNITITGTAAGISPQSTPVTVNVIAPPPTAPLSIAYCTSRIPVWLAYQNRGYSWQTATHVNGVFTFPATTTLSVAYATVSGASSKLEIDNASRDELAAQGTPDCAGTKSVTGSIGGATTGQSAYVAMGPTVATATQASPSFSLTGLASRVLDLVSIKGAITSGSSTLQVTPDKLFLLRSLNPSDGANLGTLDFAAQGFAPNTSVLTVANTSAGDSINIGNTFSTGTKTHVIVNVFQTVATSSTLYSVPAAKLTTGDYHELLVETYRSDYSGRLNYSYLGAITDRTETLAPSLSTPAVTTISTSPYMRLRGQLPVQPEYSTLTQFIFCQSCGTSTEHQVFVVVTAAYLGATPASTWDVSIPEFGAVPGLNTNWLPATSFLIYEADAFGGPASVLFGATPVPGDSWHYAYRVLSNGALLRAAALRGDRSFATERQYLRR